MQDLRHQYEELMSKLENLKTTNRRFSRQKAAAVSDPRSGNEASTDDSRASVNRKLSGVEEIGNSIFDVAFLERCQQCLEKQLTSRRQGATGDSRIKELAGVCGDLSLLIEMRCRNRQVFAEVSERIYRQNEDLRRLVL